MGVPEKPTQSGAGAGAGAGLPGGTTGFPGLASSLTQP